MVLDVFKELLELLQSCVWKNWVQIFFQLEYIPTVWVQVSEMFWYYKYDAKKTDS